MNYPEESELKIRLMTKKDFRLLEKWLSDPRVLEFYERRSRYEVSALF